MNNGVVREKTRVCHVVYNRYPADPRVRRAVEAILGPRFSVSVICVGEPGEAGAEDVAGVSVHRLPVEVIRGSRLRYLYQYTIFLLMAATQLLPRRSGRRYDIIHVHSLPDVLAFAALPSRLLGSRVILDLHESMPHLYLARFRDRPGSALHRLVQVAERLSCLVATRVVTVNATIEGLLIEEGVPAAKLMVIENAPAWTRFKEKGEADRTAAEIVIVGGLNRERDIELLLHAAKLFQARRLPQIRIIGHGERSYTKRLEQLRLSLGLEGLVSIEPEIPASAVQSVLENTLFGVVTYERNPLTELATPNKAYEYAYLGKAMVVADLPAVRRVFGDAALYYVPGDASSLAAAISTLAEDSLLRESLGKRATAVYAAHSWEMMACRLRKLYQDLADTDSRREAGI